MPNEPFPGPGGGGKGKKRSRKMTFILAERTQESGGNYIVVNANSGALGAYQVMPSNLPGWLAASDLPPMSPYAYLHDPHAQDVLAWHILGGYYDQYGPAGAAAMWYSGQPDPTKTYGNPPVYQYVADVLALMARGGFPVHYGGKGTGPGAYTLPPPHEGDWSSAIRAAGASHIRAAGTLRGYAKAISSLK